MAHGTPGEVLELLLLVVALVQQPVVVLNKRLFVAGELRRHDLEVFDVAYLSGLGVTIRPACTAALLASSGLDVFARNIMVL